MSAERWEDESEYDSDVERFGNSSKEDCGSGVVVETASGGERYEAEKSEGDATPFDLP